MGGRKSGYVRGRNYEYRVKYILQACGWLAVRCAASKPFDIIALKKGCPPLAIECTITDYKPRDKVQAQRALAERYGLVYVLLTGKDRTNIYRALEKKLAERGIRLR